MAYTKHNLNKVSFFLSGDAYSRLTVNATVLEKDPHGDKVLQLTDQRIIKLFRIKRWLSRSVVFPYSLRFYLNTLKLERKGLSTIKAQQIFYCHDIRRHGVIYQYLDGQRFDEAVAETNDDALYQKLAEYIALLHDKGVYFRSLHMGNILVLPNGGFGLIDVADMYFSMFPLVVNQRVRNFRHLFRVPEHKQFFENYGVERFVDAYIDATGLRPSRGQATKNQIKSMLEY